MGRSKEERQACGSAIVEAGLKSLDNFEHLPMSLTAQIVYLVELLEVASEEHTRMRSLNGFAPLNDIGRWEQMHSMQEVWKKQQAIR
jgi:hypothetical protein